MPKYPAKILIVDDEKSIRDSLELVVAEEYQQVLIAKDGKEALAIVAKQDFDLVLLDIRMPHIDGLEVLAQIKDKYPHIEVIMLTGMNTVSSAVATMKKGAYDYITKPFDIDELLAVIKRCLDKKKLEEKNTYLQEEIEKEKFPKRIIGKSPQMKKIFTTIKDIADKNATVLIYGESGTGKELVAREIHVASPRAENLFVAVNCAAIPENLLESELFGHEKGSFSGAFEKKLGKFEIADKGTLFLDEIGSMPLNMQGKLLRAIQEKEVERVGGLKPISVDVRIVTATNKELLDLIEEKLFREDLYYRLNVIPIKLPPLKDRTGDIKLLIGYFLEKYNKEFGKKIKGFTQKAEKLLLEYGWPGNVRELQNLIERLVVLEKMDTISEDKLPQEIYGSGNQEIKYSIEETSFKETVAEFEKDLIMQAIEKTGGDKTKAAKLLGIHRNTLLQILKKNKENKKP